MLAKVVLHVTTRFEKGSLIAIKYGSNVRIVNKSVVLFLIKRVHKVKIIYFSLMATLCFTLYAFLGPTTLRTNDP